MALKGSARKPGSGTNSKGKTGAKRTVVQRELDRAEMMKMMARGHTQITIAKHLGLNQSMISKDYNMLMDELIADRSKNVDGLVASKLAEAREFFLEAWAAWERSKEDVERTVTEEEPERCCPVCDGSGKRERKAKKGEEPKEGVCFKCDGRGVLGGLIKTVTTREPRLPDPRYIGVLIEAWKALCKLQGLNPIIPKDPVNFNLSLVNWDAVREEVQGEIPDAIEAEIHKQLPPPLKDKVSVPSTNGNGQH